MTPEQIKHMVNRFLMWKLPADFAPDGGISAVRPNYAPGVTWEPSGTNLLDATQAEEMVRHMLEGMPTSAGYVTPSPPPDARRDIMAKLSDLVIATANLAISEPDGQAPSVVSILREAQAEIMRLRQEPPQPDGVPEGHVRKVTHIWHERDGTGTAYEYVLADDGTKWRRNMDLGHRGGWIQVYFPPLPTEAPTVRGGG